MRAAPLVVLALLVGLCAVMLYRVPVHRYVVSCDRTTQVACVLEQTRTAGTRRWRVPLGSDAAAVVHVMPQRRGPARVLLYLESPARAVFAAEFEGEDAADAAATAAAQLNRVLRSSTPMAVRIEAAASPLLRWLAWAGLGVMGLLVLAAWRNGLSRAPAA